MDSEGARPDRDRGRAPWPWRRPSLEVAIGDVVIGGRRPIAIQSMTTTPTADAVATARQIAALARAGCEIVRVTVPSRPDAEALPEIRRLLAREGVRVPLVADIHFTPRLALSVVEHVEKVRVNPGNFTDRKSVAGRGYDDRRWEQDRERLAAMFGPLVDRAKELGVAIRIGTNHGSLSDRILWRWGDTPEGMVASALEFIEIAEDRGFHDIVVSMKASNTQVMTRAYRLLAERLDRRGRPYPLHLGVTEAGGGDAGRMKSAVGIAPLLAEGLGDTVRVSLTEDPLAELPVARELVALFARPPAPEPSAGAPPVVRAAPPSRRPAAAVAVGGREWGAEHPPRVELTVDAATEVEPVLFARPPVELVEAVAPVPEAIADALDVLARFTRDRAARSLLLGGEALAAVAADAGLRGRVAMAVDRIGLSVDAPGGALDALLELPWTGARLALLRLGERTDLDAIAAFARALAGRAPNVLAGLDAARGEQVIDGYRVLARALDRSGARIPLVLRDARVPEGDPRVGQAGRLGALLVDGLGDAVSAPAGREPRATASRLHGLLQAARRRLERAEFIACPSCGRTLFDLERTTARIEKLTAHLKLRIGVMGCVVNGPGEMADADYGYVGWGEGKVALFVGHRMVEKDIPADEAPQRLVELIRSRGDWTDPPADDSPAGERPERPGGGPEA
ncbi:MAG: hypothetical protein Kow0062_07050 [Acidobacteriota bacterium]